MINKYILSDNDKLIIFLTFLIYCTSNLTGTTQYESPIVLGITIFIFLLNSCRLRFGTFHIATMQFCVFCLMTIFWARNYNLAMVKAYTIFQNIILMTVLYSFYSRLKNIDPLLKIYMWTGYTVLFYTIYYFGPVRALGLGGFGRLGTAFANTNSVGLLCANTIIIHFFFYLYKKKTASILLVIPAVMLVVATQSRKAMVSMVLGVTALFVLKNSKNIKRNLLPLLRIFMILLVLLTMLIVASQTDFFSGITERMNGLIASFTGEGDADHSSSLREAMRELGWQQLRQTPLLGIGMGNARLLTNEFLGHDCYLHCNYAEMAANGGIVGLISYYGIFFYLIWKTIKYFQVETTSFIILTLIFTKLISEWGMVSYYSKTTFFLLMIYFIHLEICQNKHPEIK